jgi:hypothetical protein
LVFSKTNTEESKIKTNKTIEKKEFTYNPNPLTNFFFLKRKYKLGKKKLQSPDNLQHKWQFTSIAMAKTKFPTIVSLYLFLLDETNETQNRNRLSTAFFYANER